MPRKLTSSELANQSALKAIASAFDRFVHTQAASGILLLICTIVAMLWANSSYQHFYEALNHLSIGFHVGDFAIFKSVHHWVNDGLMAIFFLLVGLEIKREIIAGELSAWQRALLPIFGAIGGMVVPALIFVAINHNHPQNLAGWAIPMATDIAFAIGLMSLLSKRIPPALLIFLTAIAIVDDLGAVIVIAIFYTKAINLAFLLGAIALFFILLFFNNLKIRRLLPYLLVGAVMWFCLWRSGIHATIAGVLIAIAIPGRSNYSPVSLSQKLTNLMSKFSGIHASPTIEDAKRKDLLQAMENVVHEVETPLQRLEYKLHIPVNFLIIPIFVLLNAGVEFNGMSLLGVVESPLALGIIAGLVLGKMIGIFGACCSAGKIRHIQLPGGLKFRDLYPMSCLAGVGFTMSIFISELAFGGDQAMLNMAKAGIIFGSLIAACIGLLTLFVNTAQRGR